MDVTLSFDMPQDADDYESAFKGAEYRKLLRELPELLKEKFPELDTEEVRKLIRAHRIDRGLKD